MAKKKNKTNLEFSEIKDYRFKDNKRTNIPPAGLAAQGVMEDAPKQRFYYDPHLPPVLRFDNTGDADKLPELLEKARKQALSESEIQLLADALRKQEPWLEWTGKREKKWFEVDPVALNIHERVSTQAILKIAKRENVQRDLFADPEMEYREAVKFYKHDMDWTNRLILGDSLQVMASLAHRENLAGKVQMIYFDPPYGIKFASNFQSEVGKREVKDSDNDLTREPEMIKAYRDTWTLGIHSYLGYLRERLIIAKKLLNDSGSIFVQISDENAHKVRNVLDEIFGNNQFVAQIKYKTTGGRSSGAIDKVTNYLLWYTKSESFKYKQLYVEKLTSELDNYDWIEGENHEPIPLNKYTGDVENNLEKLYQLTDLTSQGEASTSFDVEFERMQFSARSNRHWTTGIDGITRLIKSGRIQRKNQNVFYKKYLQDFSVNTLDDFWEDTSMGGFRKAQEKIYVVQTNTKIIERCMLMTTVPGDLVLDPTCGSGSTAFVAEQWGRRWITIDTSRVAIALARQRMLTSRFEHYRLQNENKSPSESNSFLYETRSHITLKSIAQNLALDAIFDKYDSLLDEALNKVNTELKEVSKEIRTNLISKLQSRQKLERKKSISDSEIRKYKLPDFEFEHWSIPYTIDEEYPASFSQSIIYYREIWQKKMADVAACIQANAEQVELVDQPKDPKKTVIRVTGPFTVEGVMPAEFNMDDTSPIESFDSELETFDVATNAVSFIDNMYNLLKREGVNFTGNKHKKFSDLRAYEDNSSFINFEGEWANGDKVERKVAVSIGPQHGPVTAWQVEQVIRMAYKRGFDDVVFAGFSFTAEAQATIQDDANPKIQLHLAQIRPDVQMGDLLKNTGTGQVFTVFGSPRVKLDSTEDGQLQVTMEGVDIYDPVANTIVDSKADKVAAWFLDTDYDGRTFCITQAFFPDRDAWKKLEKALKGVIDEGKFEAFSGTVSLPFPIGEYRKAAVKVIDPRGNEVMKVLSLNKTY